jgi:hypothetical protein
MMVCPGWGQVGTRYGLWYGTDGRRGLDGGAEGCLKTATHSLESNLVPKQALLFL